MTDQRTEQPTKPGDEQCPVCGDPWADIEAREGWYGDEESVVYPADAVDQARAADAARLKELEAENERLKRAANHAYEVCGCGNMADGHCMICCRPLVEHRAIPKAEIDQMQERFAYYDGQLSRGDALRDQYQHSIADAERQIADLQAECAQWQDACHWLAKRVPLGTLTDEELAIFKQIVEKEKKP